MLSKVQKTILELIFNSPVKNFSAWGGGTALSEIYLHHRRSDDIDIILSNLPDEIILTTLTNEIKNKLKATKKSSFVKSNRFQYVFDFKDCQQKLEFVYYPFIKLEKGRKIDDIEIESLRDIAVSKTLAAYQRSEVKDTFDLFIILRKKHFKLSELVEGVTKKFGEEIDPAMLLAKMTKTLDGYSILAPMLTKKFSKGEIADFFQKELDEFLKSARI